MSVNFICHTYTYNHLEIKSKCIYIYIYIRLHIFDLKYSKIVKNYNLKEVFSILMKAEFSASLLQSSVT